jgi:branched-chain amino acid transport system ATP-binding protein
MSFLELENISFSFGGIKALSKVSFTVQEGELYALIGPNGAGKTTIFNCISGLYPPDSGKVFFNDENITHMKPHHIAERGIARTFQNIALFKNMTVIDNLLLGCHHLLKTGLLAGGIFLGKAVHEEIAYRQKVEEIIDFLEIEASRKQIIANLPYGVQKRVELGRALAMDPKVLLLDEPVSGMNVEETEDIARFIIDLKETSMTMVLVDHDMGVVMDIADRVGVLNFGTMIAEGAPQEIQQNHEVIEAYLGEAELFSELQT